MNRLFLMLLAAGALLSGIPALLQETSQPDDGKSAPMARAVSMKPQTTSTSTPSGSVRLKPDERGHYVAEFRMNGKSVTALVDTGASMVAINKTTARKLGINVGPLISNMRSTQPTARPKSPLPSSAKSRSAASGSATSKRRYWMTRRSTARC